MQTPFTFKTQADELQRAIVAAAKQEFRDYAAKLLTDAGILGLPRNERITEENTAKMKEIEAEIHKTAFDEMCRLTARWQGGTAAASNFVETAIREVCEDIAKRPQGLVMEVIFDAKI